MLLVSFLLCLAPVIMAGSDTRRDRQNNEREQNVYSQFSFLPPPLATSRICVDTFCINQSAEKNNGILFFACLLSQRKV